ncbi:unnamed protein product [Tilletia controversa]|nr:unnamed protein product [Tilletia controversa]
MSRLQRVLAVHDTMADVGLSLSDFLDEFFTSSDVSLQRQRSNWLLYRPGRQYGPLRCARLLSRAVFSTEDEAAITYGKGLADILLERITVEKDQASHEPGFRASDFLGDASAPETDQLLYLRTLMEQHLPVTVRIMECLCGVGDASAYGPQRSEISTEEGATWSLKSDNAVVVCLSIALNLRSERMNRFQTVFGLILRLKHAPKSIQTMLNRLGVATSRDTSSRHLVHFNKLALAKAQSLMKDVDAVHVLLYDNVDIYVQERSNQVTSNTRMVNLTSRTYVQLPKSFSSAALSTTILSALDAPRSLDEDEFMGKSAFLRSAGQYFLARELLDVKKASIDVQNKHTQRTIQLLREYKEACQNAHRLDEIEAAQWQLAPLPLIEANEGSIDGNLAVLEDSSITLRIYDEVEVPTNVPSSQADQSAPEATKWELLRTSVLPEGNVLLVVGDLKTHRNVEAGLKARRQHVKAEDKYNFVRSSSAPWHLHLNWVWAIFKIHFATNKVGYAASLERLRDALRRGKSALREEEPLYNEAWNLIKHTFSGWIRYLFR